MSFVNKFKPAGNPPPGVKMEYTSFGHAQNKTPYTVPTIPKQNVPAPRTQPRGGWDDEDDDEPQLRSGGGVNRGITVQTQNQGPAKKPFVQSPATSGSNKSEDLNLGPTRKTTANNELMQINEQFLASHEFENNGINDIIQPGGARVKPSDAVLNKFCQACESFQVPVIGTLLLSKLYEDLPFISKARTLYLIETIVKKVKKYLEYFKHNLSTLQGADYSNEGSADQLIKITKDIVEYIQEPNKPKLQPSFPTNLTHFSNPTPPVQQTTTNLLGGDDLLGSPEAKTSKPDPFGFVKKQASETTKAQTPSSRPTAAQPQQNNNQLLDLDFGSAPSQPQQSFTQPTQQVSQPQSQAQPKKFNPFDVPSQGQQAKPQPVTQTQTQPQLQAQNTAKPSGLPGNFKKFQGSSSSIQESTPTQQANKPTTPANQASGLNQMDDLLSSLDFSSASTTQTQPANTFSQPPTNTFNTTPQTSGPGIKSSFPTTQAPTTQPTFNQPSQPPTSFGNTSSQGGFNSNLNANKFPQSNVPGPQMNAPYGGMGGMGGMGPGNMGPGPQGFGYNAFPGYGQGPTGFNAPPQGNWNTGYPAGGYGGFNQQGGPGYGFGQQQQQQQQYPMGGFGQGQGQNFGGNNFQQGYNGMGGGFQNQGMNSYYNQPHSPELGAGGLGLYSDEAISKQEELKKKHEKAKNEALFENLKF